MPPKPAPAAKGSSSSKSASSKDVLHYFNARGRGELIRLLRAQGGVEYVDDRVEFEKWPELQPKTPGGTLPFMEIGGKPFGQSMAICRHFAREYKLFGKTALEALAIDGHCEDCVDFRNAMFSMAFEKDEALKTKKQQELKEKTVPNFLKKLNDLLSANKSGWLIGEAMSVLDLMVFDVLTNMFKNPEAAPALEKAPKLKIHREKVATQPRIKVWLTKRPDTSI